MTETQQLSRSFDDRLVEIIHQIVDARDAFASDDRHIIRSVDVRLEQVRARANSRSAQFRKERERVNSKVKRTLASAKQKAKSWKETGQSQKLRRYADQAEQFALAALFDANEAVDAALIAAMESLEARLLSHGAAQKERSQPQKPPRSPKTMELL
jgi:rhodanese-related sulfurtransferase